MSLQLKRIILFGVPVTLILLAVIIFIFYLAGMGETKEKIIEERWQIDLPNNIKELYYVKDTGWFGDGLTYTVYLYSEKASTFIDEFNSTQNEDLEDLVNKVLLELNIPNENSPDFNENYLWRKLNRHNNNLYMIYDNSKSKLYLIQNLK